MSSSSSPSASDIHSTLAQNVYRLLMHSYKFGEFRSTEEWIDRAAETIRSPEYLPLFKGAVEKQCKHCSAILLESNMPEHIKQAHREIFDRDEEILRLREEVKLNEEYKRTQQEDMQKNQSALEEKEKEFNRLQKEFEAYKNILAQPDMAFPGLKTASSSSDVRLIPASNKRPREVQQSDDTDNGDAEEATGTRRGFIFTKVKIPKEGCVLFCWKNTEGPAKQYCDLLLEWLSNNLILNRDILFSDILSEMGFLAKENLHPALRNEDNGLPIAKDCFIAEVTSSRSKLRWEQRTKYNGLVFWTFSSGSKQVWVFRLNVF
jgi:hypothetical protein